MSRVNNIAIKSFNANHALYDVYRPQFSKVLVDRFLVGLKLAKVQNNQFTFHTDKKILELAAGTGKFTRNLVNNGWKENLEVVEPSSGMLASFTKNFPDIKSYEASSYKLPIADGSVDSVIVAQGFHWFADVESLAEIRRVLKPEGTVGFIWNFDVPLELSLGSIAKDVPEYEFIFDESVPEAVAGIGKDLEKNLPATHTKAFQIAEKVFSDTEWLGKVAKFVYGLEGNVPQYRHGKWRDSLTQTTDFNGIAKEFVYFYEVQTSKADVWEYWATRSYITDLSPEKQAAAKAEVERIFDETVKESDKAGDKFRKIMGTHAVILG